MDSLKAEKISSDEGDGDGDDLSSCSACGGHRGAHTHREQLFE